MAANTFLSVLIAFLTVIPLSILKILLAKSFLKHLGVLLTAGLIGFCFYIAITNAALMDVDLSNNWAFSYFISWLIDFFCI